MKNPVLIVLILFSVFFSKIFIFCIKEGFTSNFQKVEINLEKAVDFTMILTAAP